MSGELERVFTNTEQLRLDVKLESYRGTWRLDFFTNGILIWGSQTKNLCHVIADARFYLDQRARSKGVTLA